jgi:hypothetical protein
VESPFSKVVGFKKIMFRFSGAIAATSSDG